MSTVQTTPLPTRAFEGIALGSRPSDDPEFDPGQHTSHDHTMWTRTNIGEAVPGVATPLGWSVWGPAMELGLRKGFHDFGVLNRAGTRMPRDERDCVVTTFFGRPALRADFFFEMADRLPGTNGAQAAEQLFAAAPRAIESRSRRRYYPFVAARMPLVCLRAPGQMRRARTEVEEWWRGEISRIDSAGREEACRTFADAAERFRASAYLHIMAVFAVVQPIHDQLQRLIDESGSGSSLQSGRGDHEEAAMLRDLWSCSRGGIDLDEFVTRYGYHGPREGEMAAHMWREDRGPLESVLSGYRSLGEDAGPASREATLDAARSRDERELLSSLAPARRAQARAVIALARRFLALRGVGKVSLLQSLDVCRASARRLGASLAADGILEDPEDVFFLTAAEIGAAKWDLAQEKVRFRRARHREYEALELPPAWQGMPIPEPVTKGPEDTSLIAGIGVSSGVVEGTARVVVDPSEVEMEQDDILVARTTDPSWAAVMYMSSGLVIDIGGTLSHAAVVARELGIPCVVDTGAATKLLRTGDRCRIDGDTGRVEILERGLADVVDAATGR
jgi:pyruvate, water dikinase